MLSERMLRLGTENAFAVLNEVAALRSAGKDVVSLGIGDPDFDSPLAVREAAIAALNNGRTHYSPPGGTPELRAAIAEYLARSRGADYSPDEVVVAPGAKPILFGAIMALVGTGDEVLCPSPGFPIYESVVRFAGGVPVPLPHREANGFRLNHDELAGLVGTRTRLIILNSPNNPTGAVLSREDLACVAAAAERVDAWVLSDEIYSEFVYEGDHVGISSVPSLRDRSVLVDGFSKTFAMTGWRLGYGAMPRRLAEQLEKLVVNTVSCTATFVQDAGVAALRSGWPEARAMVETFRTRREEAVRLLNAIPGVHVEAPRGAFYAFPNVTGACRRCGCADALELQQRLLHEAGVAVLARSQFGDRRFDEADEYVRISFAADIQKLRDGISRFHAWVESRSGV